MRGNMELHWKISPKGVACLLALFFILGGNCAVEAAPLYHYHRVERGETLWGIGRTHGVSPEELIRFNNISDPTKLRIGQLLRIPIWTHIIIHHSATEVGNAEIFDRGHRRRGIPHGLAYHFVISNGTSGRRDGQIEVSDRWRRQLNSACTRRRITRTISICLVGNFEHQFVSSRQFASLVWLIKELQHYYGIPPENIIGHRDVDNTLCPGKNFPWERLKRAVR